MLILKSAPESRFREKKERPKQKQHKRNFHMTNGNILINQHQSFTYANFLAAANARSNQLEIRSVLFQNERQVSPYRSSVSERIGVSRRSTTSSKDGAASYYQTRITRYGGALSEPKSSPVSAGALISGSIR